MLKGLWKLTWVETKIFVREPLGLIGSLIIPVVIFVMMGRAVGADLPGEVAAAPFNVTILAALIIAVSAVLSLIAIISIYREGGILKRLRATPMSPTAFFLGKIGSVLVTSLVQTALLLASADFGERSPGAFTDSEIRSLQGQLEGLLPTYRRFRPQVAWGLRRNLVRYNRVEGLSVGVASTVPLAPDVPRSSRSSWSNRPWCRRWEGRSA